MGRCSPYLVVLDLAPPDQGDHADGEEDDGDQDHGEGHQHRQQRHWGAGGSMRGTLAMMPIRGNINVKSMLLIPPIAAPVPMLVLR